MARVKVTKTTVYKFNELSEDGKDNAINNLWDINVYDGWWDFTLEDTADIWKNKYGITFNPRKTYFSLDRDYYIFFQDIYVTDSVKLARVATGNTGYGLVAYNDLLQFSFDNTYYAGARGRTHLNVDDYRSGNSPDLPIDFDDWFYDISQDILSSLNKEYEYLTSKDAIIETINANDYEFTDDGKLA